VANALVAGKKLSFTTNGNTSSRKANGLHSETVREGSNNNGKRRTTAKKVSPGKGAQSAEPKAGPGARGHSAKERPRLRVNLKKELAPTLRKSWTQEPGGSSRLSKIVVNMGVAKRTQNAKIPIRRDELGPITGQKPVVKRGRASRLPLSKVREGMPIARWLRLRGEPMY